MHTKEGLLAKIQEARKADTGNANIAEFQAEIIGAMASMPYEQKMIIFSFYLLGEQWERIAGQVNRSVRYCKQIRDKAIDALLHILNEKSL